MSSPLSPIAANIVMDNLETNCRITLPFQLPIHFRYVDDIITAVAAKQIVTIKNSLNSNNHKTQFTVEEESDKTIRFLDFLIIRVGTNIRTNWHQKPTYSSHIINFYSHHPLTYKINAINDLVYRGITLSHKTFYSENIKKIKSILLLQNYPTNFINSVIKNRVKRHINFLKPTLRHTNYLSMQARYPLTITHTKHNQTQQIMHTIMCLCLMYKICPENFQAFSNLLI